MGNHVIGNDTGTNNGLITTIRTTYGWAHVSIDVPERLWGYIGRLTDPTKEFPAQLYDGFVAVCDDPEYDPTKSIIRRFNFKVVVTGAGVEYEHRFTQRHTEFTVPTSKLPDGNNLTFAITEEPFVATRWGFNMSWGAFRIAWAFTNFVVPISQADRDIDFDDLRGIRKLTSIDVPTGSTRMRLACQDTPNVVGTVIDSVKLELPAREWMPTIHDVCDFWQNEDNAGGASICRYLSRKDDIDQSGNMFGCKLRQTQCSGYRSVEECSYYQPNRKCSFILAKELFTYNPASGCMEIDETMIKQVLNGKTGFGFMPTSAWRGLKDDLSELQNNFFAAVKHASKYFCHRFETQVDNPHLLPCYCSKGAAMPFAQVGNTNIWRFIDADGILDTSYSTRTHVRIKIKNADIAITNPEAKWPGNAEDGVQSSVWYAAKPALEPRVYLPVDLPSGYYDVYAYINNDSELPWGLDARYASPLKESDGDFYKKSTQRMLFPQSSGWEWKKLTASQGVAFTPVLTGGMLLEMKMYLGAASLIWDRFDTGGQFQFTSLYIERVG